MIQVSDKRPTRCMMSDMELIQAATKLKNFGKVMYNAKQIKQAVRHYVDAIAYADTVKNDSKELKDLKVKIL